MLKTTGKVVDDMKGNDPIYKDLMFFEKEFKGVLPFEISIDTKHKKGALQLSTLSRIEELEAVLQTYPEFSKPISMATVVKYSRQAFYNGDPEYFSLPNKRDIAFILSYVPKTESGKRTILNSFVDSSYQKTRISVQMANVSTPEMLRIRESLKPQIDEIFPPEDYTVEITGTSVVFFEGTTYLITNLIYSLLLALGVITILMSMLFSSYKMIGISLLPNFLPQILTAALMGYFAIPIKPSTILIFSVALGISVDNTIHFLSRYRIQLKQNNWDIRQSVVSALSETGYSMIYSSIILFFGFIIFTLSTFGGTEALGYLISFTLISAACSNLFLLPSLLLWLDKRITTRRFEDPLLEFFDEEEEFDIDELKLEKRK
jgi:predicted RND superfamily exporter protein